MMTYVFFFSNDFFPYISWSVLVGIVRQKISMQKKKQDLLHVLSPMFLYDNRKIIACYILQTIFAYYILKTF